MEFIETESKFVFFKIEIRIFLETIKQTETQHVEFKYSYHNNYSRQCHDFL